MAELYLVQAEYLDKQGGFCQVNPNGITDDYQKAKELCHKIVEEDRGEGEFPEDFKDGWNEYDDMFCYEDELTKILVYVCTVDTF